MSDDLAARLAALEARVAAFLPAFQRHANRYEQPEWLRAMVLASSDRAHAAASMSYPPVGTVEIVGLIDDAMAASVHDQLEAACFATELRVVIDSRGGDFHGAVRVYRSLRWHPATRKIARLMRRCQSAAALVMLACDHRIASTATDLLIHGTGSGDLDPPAIGRRRNISPRSVALQLSTRRCSTSSPIGQGST